MHLYRKILWAEFSGIRYQTFVVRPGNVTKIHPYLVHTLGDHCEVGIDMLGLIFCTAIDRKSANVFLKDGVTEADETLLEGNHYETENDYTIYVYHRQMGTFYDQLIGVKKINSTTR